MCPSTTGKRLKQHIETTGHGSSNKIRASVSPSKQKSDTELYLNEDHLNRIQ